MCVCSYRYVTVFDSTIPPAPSFIISYIIINLLAQKHDKVTCATKQIKRDSKDTDATNSCPRKVQIKLFRNTLQK